MECVITFERRDIFLLNLLTLLPTRTATYGTWKLKGHRIKILLSFLCDNVACNSRIKAIESLQLFRAAHLSRLTVKVRRPENA